MPIEEWFVTSPDWTNAYVEPLGSLTAEKYPLANSYLPGSKLNYAPSISNGSDPVKPIGSDPE